MERSGWGERGDEVGEGGEVGGTPGSGVAGHSLRYRFNWSLSHVHGD